MFVRKIEENAFLFLFVLFYGSNCNMLVGFTFSNNVFQDMLYFKI